MDKNKITFTLAVIDTIALIVLALLQGYLYGQCTYDKPLVITILRSELPGHKCESCLEVYGRVLGDLKPNSTVYLFRTNSTHYDDVMAAIKTMEPIESVILDDNQRYDFGCLIAGNYAAVVPGHSYAGAVGFPLPVEFTFRNLSLDIAFQGGDINQAVGAFSIQPGKSTTAAETEEICFPLPIANQMPLS